MSGERVDVLAAMDAAIRVMYRDSYSAIPDDLTKARAAVAELIEAATEVDKLSRGIGDWSDKSNVEKAVLRQRDALSRIQPDGQGE